MKRYILTFLFACCAVLISHGETYVVVAGISDYQNISDLQLPERDAKAIAELYKTKTENVILLTGCYATKARILKSLHDQFSRAKEGDMVVFSFSGHGYQGGICPYDMNRQPSSGITYDEIRSILKQSRAKQKIVFADACFSGGLRIKNEHKRQTSKNDDYNVLLFLSSRDGETSIESPYMINGFFTTYLLRGLRGGADINRDRKITAKEIFNFVHQGVIEKSNNRQHPVMWGQFDDNWVVMDWN